MGRLLVRTIDDDLTPRLEQRAVANGRSTEGSTGRSSSERFAMAARALRNRAARWRRLTEGRETTDRADLIRADRRRLLGR